MRSRPLHAIALYAAAAALLTGCAGAPAAEKKAGDTAGYPVEATSCGFTSTIEARPERAVTMNQGATEIALALGVEDQLAGTAYLDDQVAPQWQRAYDEVKVLSKEYPDHETLLAAEPDFVYGSYVSAFEPKAAGTRERLAELGIGSYLSPFDCGENRPGIEVSFESVWSEVETVGEVFDVPERAAEIRSEQEKTLAALAKSRPADGLNIFWYDSGDKDAFAGTGEGGPQLVIEAVGGSNVFADVKGGWETVSWERVVKTDPDVIVLADASWSTAEEKIELLESDPVLKELRAVKNRSYITVPFSETTPGVRLADGATHVAEQLAELDLS
ncbi:ABC transporter substrate-binding protein [Nocardioides speluncae]|uniref:ABC transporter substrate-binding protein n=1 Tax=Nocardioides speluncae TaxID=2670337 RepID=UPI000D6894EF|nr:ABC transporter substrate-binding protein [Nocardioides speluncae]